MRMDVDVLNGSSQKLFLLPRPIFSLLGQQLDLITILSLQFSLRDDLPRGCSPHILQIILILHLLDLRRHDFFNTRSLFEFILGPHFSDKKMQLF